MKAISFYIVGVVNAGDCNEAAKILDPLRAHLADDGRVLITGAKYQVQPLAEGEASEAAARELVYLLDHACMKPKMRGWLTRLVAGTEAK